MKKLPRSFYNRDTLIVARELIGKHLVHRVDGQELIVMITEVEAYKGLEDKACHSYGGKKTERTMVMWGEPGYAYVYMIYGMYYCLNVVTEPVGHPCAVLIRGVRGVKNINRMSRYRYNKEYEELSTYQRKNFTNGPGKLCNAMKITKEENGLDLLGEKLCIYENGTKNDFNIKEGKRINIDYAEEAKEYSWRFYID